MDSFLGNEGLADSVNHLLIVGFYLVNIGYVTLALRYGDKPNDAQTALANFWSTKVGLVLVVLGVMHFFNLFVFSNMRRRANQRNLPPPLQAPDRLMPRLRESSSQSPALSPAPRGSNACS